MIPKLLTIPETAEVLRVTHGRAYELARLGLLPVVKIGRQLRVDEARLLEWIREGGQSLNNGWRK